MHPKGHARVGAWYAKVSTDDLRISAMTFFEKRRGAERLSRTDPKRAAAILEGIQTLEAAYGSRVVPIDGPVAEWAGLLGAKDKNQRDRALAATARIHGLVLVPRDVDDVCDCDVDVLDPFVADPQVQRV
ncbi:MAG: PIN domain nuclease [Methylobacterium sp.]|nr:PIN domain nuclease [Methylobacterium sp.]